MEYGVCFWNSVYGITVNCDRKCTVYMTWQWPMPKIENNPQKRKLIEELEILEVKKEDKNKLINIKVDFTNEEIFYYILNNKQK